MSTADLVDVVVGTAIASVFIGYGYTKRDKEQSKRMGLQNEDGSPSRKALQVTALILLSSVAATVQRASGSCWYLWGSVW